MVYRKVYRKPSLKLDGKIATMRLPWLAIFPVIPLAPRRFTITCSHWDRQCQLLWLARSGHYYEPRGEREEKQPRAAGCVQCHKENMEQKIEGAVKLEAVGCFYCHSLRTIKDRAASGMQLPPPNHSGKNAATTPPPPPKPESKPEPKPEVKSEQRLFLFDQAWSLEWCLVKVRGVKPSSPPRRRER